MEKLYLSLLNSSYFDLLLETLLIACDVNFYHFCNFFTRVQWKRRFMTDK